MRLRQSILGVAVATVALLLVPAVAMQFTDTVAWGPGDFAAAAALFTLAGTGVALALQHPQRRVRLGLLALIVAGSALLWAELAVGLFH